MICPNCTYTMLQTDAVITSGKERFILMICPNCKITTAKELER